VNESMAWIPCEIAASQFAARFKITRPRRRSKHIGAVGVTDIRRSEFEMSPEIERQRRDFSRVADLEGGPKKRFRDSVGGV